MARPYQVKIYNVTYTTLEATVADGEYAAGGEIVTELSGQETFNFFFKKSSSSLAVAELGKVVELYNTVRVGIYKAYRIVKINPIDDGKVYKVEIGCEGLKYDLNKRRFNFSGGIIDQTPTVHLTEILTGSGWSVGTVTPTAKITVQYENDSVLEALEKVRQASGLSGVLYDLDFRTKPNFVDLKVVGNQSSTSTITYGKNLAAVTNWEQTIPNGTRIFAIGGAGQNTLPMTLELHTHRITGISGSVLTLDSDKILSDSLDWTGYDLLNVETQAQDAIVAGESASPYDKLTVSNPGFFSVGARVRIQESGATSGLGVKYIRDAITIASYGERDIPLRDENFTDVLNLVGPGVSSAFSGTYTSGLCEGWTKVGLPTVAENTDAAYLFNGTKSQKVTVASFTVTPATPAVTVMSAIPGEVNGAVNYKIAWVTMDGEGPLSTAASVSPTNDAVLVEYSESFPLADSRILFWRIYRTKAGGSTYYLITEKAIAETQFYDTLADDKLTETPGSNIAGGGQGVKRTFTTEIGKEYAVVAYIHLVSGQVRVELATGDDVFPPLSMAAEKRGSPSGQTGKWIISLQALVATGTTGEVRFLSHLGGAEFYAGAVMVVQSPFAPPSDRFVRDNGATELWYAAFDELQKEKVVKQKIACRINDKYEMGSGTDVFNVGDKVTISHTPLGLSASLRVIKKAFSFLEPFKCNIEVDTAPERYINEYAQRRQVEKRLSASLARQYTQVSGALQQVIGTAGEPSVEFRKVL